eukprot:645153-Amphidinium_carterae.1
MTNTLIERRADEKLSAASGHAAEDLDEQLEGETTCDQSGNAETWSPAEHHAASRGLLRSHSSAFEGRPASSTDMLPPTMHGFAVGRGERPVPSVPRHT